LRDCHGLPQPRFRLIGRLAGQMPFGQPQMRHQRAFERIRIAEAQRLSQCPVCQLHEIIVAVAIPDLEMTPGIDKALRQAEPGGYEAGPSQAGQHHSPDRDTCQPGTPGAHADGCLLP
jgi:hypothetical protein